ncbi:MAG TPA: YetF domain-containing protein [Pusillimonas sp.]|uniref:DUF421 domain-containing protein n=1 Tax=Pusillimonas sp. TaxID=3040095 RepID=UPI002BF20D40|nr:YetF domain-containing protein [Pusillimonas sp.]HUH87985.1 YetF domain-containing protein [Pusillimonas sp.]
MSDLGEIFALHEGVPQMILRGTAIYWTVLVLLRLAGRREVGSFGTADLLVLVLVADAAGDAMTGGSPSVTDGIVVVTTVVVWSVLLDRLAYFVPLVHRLLEPERVCLIRDGRILRSGLRSEHISRAELMEQLRLKGIESIGQVKRAYIEANGQFSVIEAGQDVPKSESTLAEP